MRKLDYFWKTNKDWWYRDKNLPRLKEDAPPEAQESYKHYLEQKKRDIS